MIGKFETRRSETLQPNDLQMEILSVSENIGEMEAETNFLADLPEEEATPPKQEGNLRLLRLAIYSLLGFGLTAIAAPAFLGVSSS